MEPTQFIVAFAAMLFTAIALYFDLKYRRIPNALTVSAFAIAVIFHVATGGLTGLGFSLAGFAAGFCPLLLLWLIGGGGGGDVKMMGALGAWLGPSVTFIIFLGSAGIAMVTITAIALARIAIRNRATSSPATTSGGVGVAEGQIETSQKLLPYAVPVTVTTWAWMIMKITLFAAQ